MRRYEANKQHLLAVLIDYAPNGAAQQKCVDLMDKIEKEIVAETDDEVKGQNEMVRALASVIVDGLTFGNWPWTVVP